MSPSPLPLARFPVVDTSSLDEARELFGRVNTPVKVERSDRKTPFTWRSNVVTIGPLAIFAHQYGGAFRATADGATDVFAISFPLTPVTGQVTDGSSTVPLVGDRTTWIASPLRQATVDIGTGYRGLQLVVRRAEMDAALAALLGVRKHAALAFESRLSLESGVGASLQRLVRFAVDEADRDEGAFASPLVAARFADALLFNLLLGQPHNQSTRLRSSRRPAEPRHVRMAAEYLVANVKRPVRMSELATLTGVSLRALQLGFLEHHGCSPTQFLKERRFMLARTRLLGHPAATVTRIALECGFEHLGRFSAHYRARFGEAPSETRARSR